MTTLWLDMRTTYLKEESNQSVQLVTGFSALKIKPVIIVLFCFRNNLCIWAATWQNQQNGIRPVWSESSLSAWRKLGSLATQWAQSEDSDQTGRMPRLIWVFAGRTCHFVGFVTMRLICTVLEQCFHLSIQHRNATFTSCPHCYINQTSPCSHSSSKV